MHENALGCARVEKIRLELIIEELEERVAEKAGECFSTRLGMLFNIS